MAITEEEAQEYQTALGKILDEHGLSWIADQANERMILGKTMSKQVSESKLIPDMFGGMRRGRRRTAEFLATEPFNEIEKLQILLDALDLGLVSPPKMQEKTLENIGLDHGEVGFVDEGVPGRSHSYRIGDLGRPTQIAEAIREAVRQIRTLL
jgi:hypothetical protein